MYFALTTVLVVLGYWAHSNNDGAVVLSLRYTFESAALLLTVLWCGRSAAGRRQIQSTVILVATAAATVALGERVSGVSLLQPVEGLIFRPSERGGFVRAQGVFPHPIVLGAVISAALPLTLARFWGVATVRPRRSMLVIALGLQVAGLVASGSRGPWGGAVIGTVVVALLARRATVRLVTTLALGAVLLLVSLPAGRAWIQDLVTGAPSSEASLSLAYRFELAEQLAGFASESPWGVGPGRNNSFSMPGVVDGVRVDFARSIDNTPGYHLVQYGLPGLSTLAILAAAVALALHRRGTSDATDRELRAGLAGSLGAVLVVSLSVVSFSWAQYNALIWALVGLTVAIPLSSSRPRVVAARVPMLTDSPALRAGGPS